MVMRGTTGMGEAIPCVLRLIHVMHPVLQQMEGHAV